tara:strand:+ start:2610 stop:2855 length:246 start_codon:yes stop_codon:yes gene_type:complete
LALKRPAGEVARHALAVVLCGGGLEGRGAVLARLARDIVAVNVAECGIGTRNAVSVGAWAIAITVVARVALAAGVWFVVGE